MVAQVAVGVVLLGKRLTNGGRVVDDDRRCVYVDPDRPLVGPHHSAGVRLHSGWPGGRRTNRRAATGASVATPSRPSRPDPGWPASAAALSAGELGAAPHVQVWAPGTGGQLGVDRDGVPGPVNISCRYSSRKARCVTWSSGDRSLARSSTWSPSALMRSPQDCTRRRGCSQYPPATPVEEREASGHRGLPRCFHDRQTHRA